MNNKSEQKGVKPSGVQNPGNTPKAKGSGNRQGTTQPAKRTHSELSNTSVEELTVINEQLDELHNEMKSNKELLKSLMTKEDITDFVQVTVKRIVAEIQETLFQKVEEQVREKVRERTEELHNRLDFLTFENAEMKEKLDTANKTILEFQAECTERMLKSEEMARNAMRKANFNEQYSRKNNFKLLGVKEQENETTDTVSREVCALLEVKAGISLRPEQIIAIHRIPGKAGSPKPILVRLRNNSDKGMVMRKRKEIKAAGFKLVDDVTKLNAGLISRLSLHGSIDSAWFFNGFVYGKTTEERRFRFDLYDSIDAVIKPRRAEGQAAQQDQLETV